jgi:hypothetical protein
LPQARAASLAAEAGTDVATVTALFAGLKLIRSGGQFNERDPWELLMHIGGPWLAFERIGIAAREPLAIAGNASPDKDTFRSSYDTAIDDIVDARGAQHLKNGFYRQVADAVFETCYEALEHYVAWNDERGAAERASVTDLRAVKDHTANVVSPRLHVVSAPMGSGKTTFTTAFIMAMVRLSKSYPQMPYGAAFLVDQIVKADGMYQELDKHLPGEVAIWTSDHDVGCTEPQKVPNPAARFSKEDLRNYPVVIVTHALFQGEGSDTARIVLRDGEKAYRALTLADEQMEDVQTYSVQLSSAERIRELMQDAGDEIATTKMAALLRFMWAKANAGEGPEKPRSLEKPADDEDAWKLDLAWFATEEAKRYTTVKQWPNMDQAFGFARCMASDYAFIARDNKGQAGTHFVGYEPKHAIVPGMVLLDATADVDGITRLCPWRNHAEVPHGRYDNLSVVFANTCADNGNLTRFLKSKSNQGAYAEWMQQVIRAEMEAGQRGLVVCKKTLIDTESIPGPYPRNPAAVVSNGDPPFVWDLDGRKLGVTYWGGPGLGSNAWKDADVVFLFDDYHLPRRAVIAETQGQQLAQSNDGVLASMTALNSSSTEVDWIGVGHILRWVRQMALRGRGRVFDEHGVCGHQKVVITGGSGSLPRLALHKEQLFPGAKLSVSRPNGELWGTKYVERLLVALSDPTLPSELTTGQVGKLMGRDWRSSGKDIINDETRKMLRSLGWTYVARLGRGGSLFRRMTTEDLGGSGAPGGLP